MRYRDIEVLLNNELEALESYEAEANKMFRKKVEKIPKKITIIDISVTLLLFNILTIASYLIIKDMHMFMWIIVLFVHWIISSKIGEYVGHIVLLHMTLNVLNNEAFTELSNKITSTIEYSTVLKDAIKYREVDIKQGYVCLTYVDRQHLLRYLDIYGVVKQEDVNRVIINLQGEEPVILLPLNNM